ncbi:MAG: general secretion pathway protein GspE [Archangium gephyra]|uniref:General secretion pathway protein GspE n=1 Tax=Archangium gephyra TaxID=48 RepID=A0A2W5TGX9_9BACT|nr:MAG: general secretion pathway protein GspE [Archangium gephyra]
MPRLGELLVEEKLVQPAQLEEALETQVIHGGRLGTNLVELGFLKEADLARVLGRQHNLPFASGDMAPDQQALAVADRQFYDDQDVLPMRVDATRLTVAVLGPGQMKATDALGFKAGKRVVMVIIPEFRMNQLLRTHCKAFRPMRPIDMNALRPSTRKQEQRDPKPGDVGELINEEDFAKIYAQAALGGVAEEEEVIEGAALEEDAPIVGGTPIAPPEPQHPPLTFAQAQAQLQKSSNREDIAITVLQFAQSRFRRALLLNVQGELVTGWHGMGRGVRERAVQRIGVTLREANTFQLVSKLKSHFIGPMKRTPGMETFYKLLGGDFPQTAVILPLLVRSKLVHLLYVDHGPKQLTPPDVGELLILSQSVTRSYEALIRQRQAARAH